ncbi:MAG: CPBP family intramembrane glutamic endopeptidase [Pirellulaceae bacterium]
MTAIESAGSESSAGQGAGYWRESTRPLISLAFVMPMLLAYEVGVLLLGEGAARNGIEVLLRSLLEMLGFGQYFLLPLLTAAILLGWHHTTGRPWRIRSALLPCMLMESIGLGLALLILAQLHGTIFAHLEGFSPMAAAGASASDSLSRIVAYFGAGIYEELLFRLMLLPVVAAGLKLCGVSNLWSLVAALLLTSLIFSAAHYRMFTGVGDDFAWFSFVFRAVAGLFFSLLFLYRGFGIAVGAHALYDILVVVF